jgi:hypothetical protein
MDFSRVSSLLRGVNIMKRFVLTIFFITLITPIPAHAGDISLHGFLQGNYSAGVDGSNPDGGDFKWAEEKLQLKVSAGKGSFSLFIKTDLSYDHISEEADLELREGYLDYFSDYWDLRVGRQVITWGVGDLIFINDTFPKDYEAFFSGRPMEYLKKGFDGIKIGVYPSFASAEMVIIPFFEPNVYPSGRRFYMYDPMPDVMNRREKEPTTNTDNTEIALRVYRNIAGFDTSLYFYRGFFRQSSMLPDSMLSPTRITFFYPELSVYGASLQGRALDGIVSFETGYYDSRQDRSGTDPMVPNNQTRFLIGYQKQLWEDFTAGVQYYTVYMHDYTSYKINVPSRFPQEKRLQDILTLRLTHLFMHQTLRLSFFSFWSVSDGDYLFIPEVKYNFTDHIWAAVGANIFGGGENWSQFGSLDKNDNLYVQVRYEF